MSYLTHKSKSASRQSAAFTLVELLVVITIIGILIALLLPAVQAAREAARRMQCSNNFKQVGLALHNYHSVKECFPPGQFVNWGFWSWSTYLLPYIEQQGIYDMIDWSTGDYVGGVEATTNSTRLANGTFISAYMCPSDPQSGEWVMCTNRGHVGPDPDDDSAITNMCGVADSYDYSAGTGLFLGLPSQVDGIMAANQPCRIADVRDGTSNTLIVGEVAGKGPGTRRGHFWSAWNVLDTRDPINGPYTAIGGVYPSDAQGGLRATGFASYHPGGCNFTLADGSVHFISQNTAQNVLWALTTRDSKRSNGDPDAVLTSGPP